MNCSNWPHTSNVSIELQQLAAHIERHLWSAAGKRQSFVLIVADTDGIAHDLYNCSRDDAIMLLEGQVEFWKANKAEIPAHYNPNLKKT